MNVITWYTTLPSCVLPHRFVCFPCLSMSVLVFRNRRRAQEKYLHRSQSELYYIYTLQHHFLLCVYRKTNFNGISYPSNHFCWCEFVLYNHHFWETWNCKQTHSSFSWLTTALHNIMMISDRIYFKMVWPLVVWCVSPLCLWSIIEHMSLFGVVLCNWLAGPEATGDVRHLCGHTSVPHSWQGWACNKSHSSDSRAHLLLLAFCGTAATATKGAWKPRKRI